MDSTTQLARCRFWVILVSTVCTVIVFVTCVNPSLLTKSSEITSLSAHISSMANTNSDASVSEFRIQTRTIGRITTSSGTMKFSAPVAPSQVEGFSFSSSPSAPLFSSPDAASFLAFGSAMMVGSNPMVCLPPLRGAGVWPSCLKS